MAKKVGYLTPEKLKRAKDDWCEECAKPSSFEAFVYCLMEDGVTPWGNVRGCPECDIWTWTSLTGKVKRVKYSKEN